MYLIQSLLESLETFAYTLQTLFYFCFTKPQLILPAQAFH